MDYSDPHQQMGNGASGGPLGLARPLYDVDNGKAKPAWDERRGVHLLSPGDVVRYDGDMWDVTGVYLATDRRGSTVTLTAQWDRFKTELRLPLPLIEGACEVFLKARRCPLPSEEPA